MRGHSYLEFSPRPPWDSRISKPCPRLNRMAPEAVLPMHVGRRCGEPGILGHLVVSGLKVIWSGPHPCCASKPHPDTSMPLTRKRREIEMA